MPPVAFAAQIGEAGSRPAAARNSTHVESDSGVPWTGSGAGFHPHFCRGTDVVDHRFGPHPVGGTRPECTGPAAFEAQTTSHSNGQVLTDASSQSVMRRHRRHVRSALQTGYADVNGA